MSTDGSLNKSSEFAALFIPFHSLLQRVQIRQQVLNLLVGHDLAEAFHFGSSILDDLGHAVVACGQSAYRQVLLFEDALQARAFLAAR